MMSEAERHRARLERLERRQTRRYSSQRGQHIVVLRSLCERAKKAAAPEATDPETKRHLDLIRKEYERRKRQQLFSDLRLTQPRWLDRAILQWVAQDVDTSGTGARILGRALRYLDQEESSVARWIRESEKS